MGHPWGKAGTNMCFSLNLYLYLLCHCLCICIWGSVGVSNGLSEGCGRCSNFKHLTNTCFEIVFQGDALNCRFSIQFYTASFCDPWSCCSDQSTSCQYECISQVLTPERAEGVHGEFDQVRLRVVLQRKGL